MRTDFLYRLAVLIGRFQPWHQGHLNLLDVALQNAPRCLVVLGSAQSAPSAKNPWSAQEREIMIRASLVASQAERVCFAAQDDCYDLPLWAASVQALAHALEPNPEDIVLIGHYKDPSSVYLSAFPAWAWVSGSQVVNANASDIRAALFAFVLKQAESNSVPQFRHALLSSGVEAWLQAWVQTDAALRLAREW